MNIKTIESKKKKLVISLEGESHTLCNAVKDELWNDADVDIAAYRISHPLTSHPEILVETLKDEPKKALEEAAKRLAKTNSQVSKKFEATLK